MATNKNASLLMKKWQDNFKNKKEKLKYKNNKKRLEDKKDIGLNNNNKKDNKWLNNNSLNHKCLFKEEVVIRLKELHKATTSKFDSHSDNKCNLEEINTSASPGKVLVNTDNPIDLLSNYNT